MCIVIVLAFVLIAAMAVFFAPIHLNSLPKRQFGRSVLSLVTKIVLLKKSIRDATLIFET